MRASLKKRRGVECREVRVELGAPEVGCRSKSRRVQKGGGK